MKRSIAVVLTVLAAAVLGGSAWATDITPRRIDVKWAYKVAGTNFTGTAADTQFVTDEADSTRTDWIDTSTWAWDTYTIPGASSAAIIVANVEIACNTNNAAADTIYYMIEKRAQGRGVAPGRATQNSTMAAAAGSQALIVGGVSATQAMYRGVLLWDPDTPATINQLVPGDVFRLVVKGDQGGTTPKLSGTRVTIYTNIRRQSVP